MGILHLKKINNIKLLSYYQHPYKLSLKTDVLYHFCHHNVHEQTHRNIVTLLRLPELSARKLVFKITLTMLYYKNNTFVFNDVT